MKRPRKTLKQLEREVVDLKAQLVHNYHFASKGIEKSSIDCMTGSAVILHLTALGGKDIVSPVSIKDGLSTDTIQAIKRDLNRSFEIATLFKP